MRVEAVGGWSRFDFSWPGQLAQNRDEVPSGHVLVAATEKLVE